MYYKKWTEVTSDPLIEYVVNVVTWMPYIGHVQSIKTGVLLIFSFITGDKTEFLSPMMFSNEYITGIWLSEFYRISFLLLSIKFNTNV